MVRHPPLGIVVSSNSLAAVSTTDLQAAFLGYPRIPVPFGLVQEPGSQHSQCLGPILVLGLLILASYDYPGGDVGHPDGRAGLINLLTPWPGGPHGLNL